MMQATFRRLPLTPVRSLLSTRRATIWLQAGLYFLLLTGLLLLPIAWPLAGTPVFGLVISALVLTGLVGWVLYRSYQLQQRVRKLEAQVRSLQLKRGQAFSPQTLAHLDVEELFTDSQTRH